VAKAESSFRILGLARLAASSGPASYRFAIPGAIVHMPRVTRHLTDPLAHSLCLRKTIFFFLYSLRIELNDA
jgi:hypothetical protein